MKNKIMRRIRLDSILLFFLVIPVVMTYRLSPGETPFWLFGLIFLGLLGYLCLDLISLKQKTYFSLKYALLWLLIIGVIGSVIYSAIVVRHRTHPVYMIHDIIIQQEAAVYNLVHGKNPYAITYFDTPLAQWNYSDKETNPALYHFVMQPLYVLFAIPFYWLSNHTIGYFDGRIPLFFLFFIMLFLAGKLVKDGRQKLLFIILLSFNPAMFSYTMEGRSDVFMFAFLFAGFIFLYKKLYGFSGLPIALAFAIKQSSWPILPLYLAFLYFRTKSVRATAKVLLPFFLTFGAIVLPFLIWDKKAFIDSTILYLSGSVPHSYPVSGYGFGMLLSSLGFIKDLHTYYPFFIYQSVVGIPVLTALILYLRKNPSVARLITTYGIFLFVFWYFSRYFNNSHLGYLSMVFITAYFWPTPSQVGKKDWK